MKAHRVRYYVRLPRGHLAREAFEEAMALDAMGKGNWVADLRAVISELPYSTSFPDAQSVRDEQIWLDLTKDIRTGADKWLHTLLEDNELLYLLHGRKERVGSGEVRVVRRSFAGVPQNRESRPPCGAHQTTGRKPHPSLGNWSAEETPEHVLLECRGVAEVITQRQRVRQLLMNVLKPDDMERIRSVGSRGTDQLRILISIDKASVIVAPFAYKVMKTVRQVAS
ncbi:hypothetical protein CC1G_15379 [Coprinopsis cinerea okayama7|uniref:Uncharacterized protein n=1 Tax=Coprinopsis cinerea (strain Okayama-7 / 130 / ATCC MYA-4618 / FGSC 9003) TaxID=240176 RepID=D6RQL0_COPC7|nr:hypothetical protein CC1G_15379 [Coprinopsis cinerea okayama7\|eukprot:XP_002910101.1 hypothetical protein CC1G_15379 [Coprinopsis cinerea okayama7\